MIKKTLTLSCMAALLLSCSSQNQYIIHIDQDRDSPVKKSIHQKVGISDIQLPNYLLKYSIAKRLNSNKIEYLSNHIWADRLDLALKRELIKYLADHSTNQEIVNYPWSALPDLTIEVTINEFIAYKQTITLSTSVKLYYQKSGRSRIYQFVEKGNFSGKDEDIASAMSAQFAKLSYKIDNIIAKK